MGKVLDFKKIYAKKIFAIDPAFSKNGGCGWAIINKDAELLGGVKNKPIIHRSGLIKPFADLSNLIIMNELCDKIVEIWRNDSGYSREPEALVIERPNHYPKSCVSPSIINELSIFVGMISKSPIQVRSAPLNDFDRAPRKTSIGV